MSQTEAIPVAAQHGGRKLGWGLTGYVVVSIVPFVITSIGRIGVRNTGSNVGSKTAESIDQNVFSATRLLKRRHIETGR